MYRTLIKSPFLKTVESGHTRPLSNTSPNPITSSVATHAIQANRAVAGRPSLPPINASPWLIMNGKMDITDSHDLINIITIWCSNRSQPVFSEKTDAVVVLIVLCIPACINLIITTTDCA